MDAKTTCEKPSWLSSVPLGIQENPWVVLWSQVVARDGAGKDSVMR